MNHLIKTICFSTLIFCFSCQNSAKKVDPEIDDDAAVGSTGLCDYAMDEPYYKIHDGIGLPQVQDIPGYDKWAKAGQPTLNDSLIAYLQFRADEFSWLNFIAMNWPSDTFGNPDTSICFGEKDHIAVWEHWIPEAHVFQDDGAEPMAWPDDVDENGVPHHHDDPHLFRANGKDPDFTIINAEDAPVVDQDSNFTLYQISYNKVIYDYIVETGLYSQKGQQEFVKSWPDKTKGLIVVEGKDTINIAEKYQRAYFSIGNEKDSTKTSGRTTYRFITQPVSIAVKSAWTILDDGEDQSKFHTRILNYSADSTVTLGLVGMHFIQKVAESTQWVWSTFEHVDNSPDADENGEVILPEGEDYIYFNESDTNKSGFNLTNPIDLETQEFANYPTQVVRELPILTHAEEQNARFHEMIKAVNENSVWLNYELVGTQWPFTPTLFTAGDDYQPSLLANSVMETYKQTTSSCMGCHKNARFSPSGDEGKSYFSDFIFSLNRAQ